MFAVIKTGGKQYSVAAGDVITVMALDGAPGDAVTFDEVLMLGGDSPKVGAPTLAGVKSPARSPSRPAAPSRSPSRSVAGRIQSASAVIART